MPVLYYYRLYASYRVIQHHTRNLTPGFNNHQHASSYFCTIIIYMPHIGCQKQKLATITQNIQNDTQSTSLNALLSGGTSQHQFVCFIEG